MTETLAPALPPDIDERARLVLAGVCRRHWRLAVAESCTGGLFSSLLTDIEGCGHAFERGFVVYSDEAKRDMLGVAPDLLRVHGAVSEGVARAMADGGLAASRADLCLAITGFAGPGAPDEPAGLVHFALAQRGAPMNHRRVQFKDTSRGGVRIGCLSIGLDMIEAALD